MSAENNLGRTVGNKRTKEVHISDCRYVNEIRFKRYFTSVEEALNNGYDGCGHCLKNTRFYNPPIFRPPVLSSGEPVWGKTYAEDQTPWDLVVVGGGPIGLSTAKCAGDKMLKVLVLEKENTCGPRPRAESVDQDPVIEAIWGKGFMKYVNHCSDTILHSPEGRQCAQVHMNEMTGNFDWRVMIEDMVKILAQYPNICIQTGTAVQNARFDVDVHCLHWETDDTGLSHYLTCDFTNSAPLMILNTSRGVVVGHTFFDCSGNGTLLGRQLGSNFDSLLNPIVKSRVSNYPTGRHPLFQTYFVSSDTVKAVRNSPPAMVVVFPSHPGQAEVDCLVFSEYGPDGKRRPDDPAIDPAYVMQMWHDIKTHHPVLQKVLAETQVMGEEEVTSIPCQRRLQNAMNYPGLVSLGDAGGFMRADLAATLTAGMKSARWWVDRVVEQQGLAWTDWAMNQYNAQFRNQDIYNLISYKHFTTRIGKSLAWELWRTSELINVHWKDVLFFHYMGEKMDAMAMDNEAIAAFDWPSQAALINTILGGSVVGELAQNRILGLLQMVKKSLEQDPEAWGEFLKILDRTQLFLKMKGREDLKKLYQLLGPWAPVECALAKREYTIVLWDVEAENVRAASLEQAADLADFLRQKRPLLKQARSKLLMIIEVMHETWGKNSLAEGVRTRGGAESYYVEMDDDSRKRLRAIIPVKKTCTICSGAKVLIPVLTCSICNGAGQTRHSCPVCGGDGQINDNWPPPINCWNCEGTGQIQQRCPVCKGDGQIWDKVPKPSPCGNCGGTGINRWGFRCLTCGGNGLVNDRWPKPRLCPACQGRGNFDHECRVCEGDGKLLDKTPKPGICPNCRGKKEIELTCGICRGDGKILDKLNPIPCWNCEQNGWVLL